MKELIGMTGMLDVELESEVTYGKGYFLQSNKVKNPKVRIRSVELDDSDGTYTIELEVLEADFGTITVREHFVKDHFYYKNTNSDYLYKIGDVGYIDGKIYEIYNIVNGLVYFKNPANPSWAKVYDASEVTKCFIKIID